MNRKFLIPKESYSDLEIFFNLTDENISKIIDIIKQNNIKKAEDFCVAIVNNLGLTDSESTSIFKVFSFILNFILEYEATFEEVISELIDSANRENNTDLRELIESGATNNKDQFDELFMLNKKESKGLKKLWLSSSVIDSVIQIKTICDIRPVFNEKREEIEDYIPICHFEIIITNSLDQQENVHLTFNKESFEELKDKIKETDQKFMEVINKIDKLMEEHDE